MMIANNKQTFFLPKPIFDVQNYTQPLILSEKTFGLLNPNINL